jgi:hypothetical protein
MRSFAVARRLPATACIACTRSAKLACLCDIGQESGGSDIETRHVGHRSTGIARFSVALHDYPAPVEQTRDEVWCTQAARLTALCVNQQRGSTQPSMVRALPTHAPAVRSASEHRNSTRLVDSRAEIEHEPQWLFSDFGGTCAEHVGGTAHSFSPILSLAAATGRPAGNARATSDPFD